MLEVSSYQVLIALHPVHYFYVGSATKTLWSLPGMVCPQNKIIIVFL